MGSYRLHWRECLGGHLAIGHKPGKKLRKLLDESGCTLVVNLLSKHESSAVPAPNRIRLPLATAACPGPQRDEEIVAAFEAMERELGACGKVFIHCSAGIHRTGMIAYAFLRWSGMDNEAAMEAIRDMREITASELTAERAALGERLSAAMFRNGGKSL